MPRLLFFFLIIISAALTYAADVTKTYNNKDFTGVSVCCGMKIRINQSDNFSVKVTADEKDFEFLTVEQNGNSLRFYINKNNYRLRQEIRIEVSMPELQDIDLSGGALANINMKTSKSFSADLSGGAFLKGNMECRDADLDLSGGSKVELKGTGGDIDLNGSGGSIFDLKDYSVKNVESQLSGGSNVKITMDGTINTSQSGGSQIVFYGTAKIGRTAFSGGSGVSKGD
jgi:hypothetical protein